MPVSPPPAVAPADDAPDDDAPADDAPAAPPADRATTALVPTHACANCHHRFVGRYCSHCGQKADARLTVLDIVGSFLRELVDLDRGLWPTLKGLTRHPGRMLAHYLGGARKQYMNPGRYLLLAVIVTTLGGQALLWAGVEAASPTADVAEGEPEDPFDAGARDLLASLDPGSGPEGPIAVTLLMVVSLSLLYRRLFPARLTRFAEALALTCFATAHAVLITFVMGLAYKIPTHLVTGDPVGSTAMIGLATQAVYLGVAVYGCLGRHPLDGLRAALVVPWAFVEVIVGLLLLVGLYAGVLALLSAESYAQAVAEVETGAVVALALVFAALGGGLLLVRAGLVWLLRVRDA
jgi:hypothetical protein